MGSVTLGRCGYPACFDSVRQFQEWQNAAARCRPGDSLYCADCTQEYQANMIRARRCAYPGTTFHVVSDESLVGVRPSGRMPMRKARK